jgi:iron complex outermembrane receptor protein
MVHLILFLSNKIHTINLTRMNYHKTTAGIFAVIIIFCLGMTESSLQAQELAAVRLLDKSTNMPITGATYQYGNQSGQSDEKGIIEFNIEEGLDMVLSHVGYGKWELSALALKSVINSGVSYKESIAVNLYPVTVIALRPSLDDSESLSLDYEEKMAYDGGAILNQTPAINSIRKSGAFGFDPVLRGFKYDQLNIVLNGAQSATAACPNRMDPPTSQMAPNMMDRIEVLKGPHAMRYGGTVGGTINFIPAPLRFSEQGNVYGRLSGGYDSNGNILRSEGLIGFSGNGYDLGIFAAWSQGNDYETGDGQMIMASFKRGNFGSNLGLKISKNQQLRLSLSRNIARDVDFPALPMDLRKDDTWMFNARHDISLSKSHLKSWNTTIYGSFVDHMMDNYSKTLDPRMVNAETNANTRNYGGRTEGVWKFENANLFSGFDIRIEGAEGTRTREFLMGPNAGNIVYDNPWQNGQISKAGVFGEYHLHHKQFEWIFSGRLELNVSEIKNAEPEFTEVYDETSSTQINPNLSVGGIKSLKNDISIGFWLARAQRSAGLTERFINYFPVGQDPYEMLGNPQLDPEVNNQLDLTFEWKTPTTVIDLDIFVSYLQDYISSVIDTTLSPRMPMSPGVRQFINIDQVFKTGFEISWSQRITKGLFHQFSMAYTYGQDLELDEPLPEIAPLDLRYRLYGNYVKNKLKPEISFRYVLKQSRISSSFGETETPAFTVVDFKISYQVVRIFGMTAGIQNLFNQNYYEHLNRSIRGSAVPIYAPGRNFYLSVNFNFM